MRVFAPVSGMRPYDLTFCATLDDLVGCWSRASGQDLAGWAEQWLRAEGTTAIVLDADGAVVQDVPRRQRIGIGSTTWTGTASCTAAA